MSENPIITELTPEQEVLIPEYQEIILPNLTSEQKALIPVYREKWRKIALSTEKVDKEKATKVIKTAYQWLNREEPLIEFFDSPYIAFKEINEIGADSLYFSILSDLCGIH